VAIVVLSIILLSGIVNLYYDEINGFLNRLEQRPNNNVNDSHLDTNDAVNDGYTEPSYEELANIAAREAIERIRNGEYQIGDTLWFGTTGLHRWRLLEACDQTALLMADFPINQPFNRGFAVPQDEVCWETSTLREYLNNDFLQRVFTDYQIALLRYNYVLGVGRVGRPFENNTLCKVYIFCIDEMLLHFPDPEARRFTGSRGQGTSIMLRNPGRGNEHTLQVSFDGSVRQHGIQNWSTLTYALPVIRLNISE